MTIVIRFIPFVPVSCINAFNCLPLIKLIMNTRNVHPTKKHKSCVVLWLKLLIHFNIFLLNIHIVINNYQIQILKLNWFKIYPQYLYNNLFIYVLVNILHIRIMVIIFQHNYNFWTTWLLQSGLLFPLFLLPV